ncbi:MAG: L,D-transpeptidase family protein [Gammaproteobacteria bacterium]|uniref:L,D-transpeptidase family protein n=1 Tax=Pseudomonadaceae TaxID=135621 RepID=UPI000617BB0D|nr:MULTISPECIES: L,D-transpeptidase family protein [Pseudomonadaceae]MAL38145.1 murein L,D-transpeptidase [Pseudomonas sp.]MBU0949977.1 L,D-transpeptidase family protein [Gammaproteobacteria bacterium]MBK3794098.1 L,D-transpeptidase family protein [Stutzerimonas stutzeri]MBK3875588.1 L,D-transpeptidase family protein [Stutzerimonas stutzeri]MBU2283095.1 L,D-transpeptidase family protein [Gammaproteobacteria bacterium]
MYKKHTSGLLFTLLLAPWLAVAEPVPEPAGSIQGVLQNLPSACGQPLADVDTTALERLSEFYRRKQFDMLWTSYTQIDALLVQIEALVDDGLEPAAYHPEAIRRAMLTATRDPLHRECSDVLASHAYLSALGHLAQGRLPQDRIEPVWHRPDAAATPKAEAHLMSIASEGLEHLEHTFNKARPSLEQYNNLRKAYARLRDQPEPEWQPIPTGQTLRPGMSDPRVPLLRQRLSADGYLLATAGAPGADDRYSDQLVDALKAFQRRHALQDDGILGADTLTELNATPANRLNQLRVNLERFRWLSADIEPRSLLVDIAGGRVIYFRDSSPQWEARIQVGRDTRQTPSIKSIVTRITLNPTWTVPPTILREDKLPQIRENPSYLAQHNMQVLDYEGRVLDPATIDWSNPGRILLRQAAGPDNPLGRVVIRFANPYSIYLHDTPSQGLFARSQRAFSSGCVRVESVMQLVDLLLSEAERERVAQLLDTGLTYEYRPTEPTPILLAYWTAEADSNGLPRYRPDVYRRDQKLLAALQAADRGLVPPAINPH